MAARPRTEPTSLPAPARALRAWGVGVLAAAILISAAALAYTSVQPTERAASRTITDIEFQEDVTLQSITAQPGFRPVLRKVRNVPVVAKAVVPPRRSGTAGRPPAGNRGGAGTRRPGGGTSVRPPSGGGGGGGGGSKPPTRATQPTPATPAPTTPAPAPEQPSPAVAVVTIPPQAVGPVELPPTAVGPQVPVHPPAHGVGVPPGLL